MSITSQLSTAFEYFDGCIQKFYTAKVDKRWMEGQLTLAMMDIVQGLFSLSPGPLLGPIPIQNILLFSQFQKKKKSQSEGKNKSHLVELINSPRIALWASP